MKCLACDVILTDRQAVRRYINKDGTEGHFIDLCDHCLEDTGILSNDMDDEPDTFNDAEGLEEDK